MSIHPSAIIGPNVKLGKEVTVGPFALIEGKTTIGDGCTIESHAHIGNSQGIVRIGKNNHILTGAVVGSAPQDLSFKGEETRLEVGDGNTIREFVTINLGTTKAHGATKIGDKCMLMAYVHIAHDCSLGNNVVIANTTQLAGHVDIGDFARIGGMCGIAQFIRIGRYAYLGGDSSVNKDVLPYSIAQGNWAVVRATNKIGLERAGFSKDDVDAIHKAIRFLIMGERTVDEALEKIEAECAPSDHLQHLIQFVRESKPGVAR